MHVLWPSAERGLAPSEIVLQYPVDLAILALGGEALVRPDVVDLAVQYVRPLEHLLRLGDELRVLDLDHRFLEREPRRLDEQTLRDEVVLTLLESRRWRVRLGEQSLVQNRVTVIEGVEQPVCRRVVPPEFPVVRCLAIELVIRRGPLRVSDPRDREGDEKRSAGHQAASKREAAGSHHRRLREYADPKVTYQARLSPLKRRPMPASMVHRLSLIHISEPTRLLSISYAV